MRYAADLHIHSVLSPCADFLMTMENIFKKLKKVKKKLIKIFLNYKIKREFKNIILKIL